MPISDAMPQEVPAEQVAPAAEGGGQTVQIITANAMEFLHEEKNAQRLVQQAQQMDPIEVAATTLGNILEAQAGSAKKAGAQITPEDLVQAAQNVAMEIADIFEAAGVIEEAQQDQFARQAVGRFAEMAQQAQGGQQQPGAQQAPAQAPAGGGAIRQAMGG